MHAAVERMDSEESSRSKGDVFEKVVAQASVQLFVLPRGAGGQHARWSRSGASGRGTLFASHSDTMGGMLDFRVLERKNPRECHFEQVLTDKSRYKVDTRDFHYFLCPDGSKVGVQFTKSLVEADRFLRVLVEHGIIPDDAVQRPSASAYPTVSLARRHTATHSVEPTSLSLCSNSFSNSSQAPVHSASAASGGDNSSSTATTPTFPPSPFLNVERTRAQSQSSASQRPSRLYHAKTFTRGGGGMANHKRAGISDIFLQPRSIPRVKPASSLLPQQPPAVPLTYNEDGSPCLPQRSEHTRSMFTPVSGGGSPLLLAKKTPLGEGRIRSFSDPENVQFISPLKKSFIRRRTTKPDEDAKATPKANSKTSGDITPLPHLRNGGPGAFFSQTVRDRKPKRRIQLPSFSKAAGSRVASSAANSGPTTPVMLAKLSRSSPWASPKKRSNPPGDPYDTPLGDGPVARLDPLNLRTTSASFYAEDEEDDEQFDTPQAKTKEAVDTKANTTSRRALRFVKTMLGGGRKKTKREEGEGGGGGGGGRQRSMSDADAFDSQRNLPRSTPAKHRAPAKSSAASSRSKSANGSRTPLQAIRTSLMSPFSRSTRERGTSDPTTPTQAKRKRSLLKLGRSHKFNTMRVRGKKGGGGSVNGGGGGSTRPPIPTLTSPPDSPAQLGGTIRGGGGRPRANTHFAALRHERRRSSAASVYSTSASSLHPETLGESRRRAFNTVDADDGSDFGPMKAPTALGASPDLPGLRLGNGSDAGGDNDVDGLDPLLTQSPEQTEEIRQSFLTPPDSYESSDDEADSDSNDSDHEDDKLPPAFSKSKKPAARRPQPQRSVTLSVLTRSRSVADTAPLAAIPITPVVEGRASAAADGTPRPHMRRTPSKSRSISKSMTSQTSQSLSTHSVRQNFSYHIAPTKLSNSQLKKRVQAPFSEPRMTGDTPTNPAGLELPLPLPLPLPRNANNKPRSGSGASANSTSEPISLPASPIRGPRKAKTLLAPVSLPASPVRGPRKSKISLPASPVRGPRKVVLPPMVAPALTQVPATSVIPSRGKRVILPRRHTRKIRKYATMTPQFAQRVKEEMAAHNNSGSGNGSSNGLRKNNFEARPHNMRQNSFEGRPHNMRQNSFEARPHMHSDAARTLPAAYVSQTPQPAGRPRNFSSTRKLPTQGSHTQAHNQYRVKYPTISSGRAGGTSPAIFATTSWAYRGGKRKRPPPPPLPPKLVKPKDGVPSAPHAGAQPLRTPPVSLPATPKNTPPGALPSAFGTSTTGDPNSNRRKLSTELAKHSSRLSALSKSRTLTSLKSNTLPTPAPRAKRASLSSIFQPLASLKEQQAAETLCQLQGPEQSYTEETHVTSAERKHSHASSSKSVLPLTEAVLASHNASTKPRSRDHLRRRSSQQLQTRSRRGHHGGAPSTTSSRSGVLFEGWLQVRERSNEGSISRYVILTVDTLSYYFANPSDAKSLQGKHTTAHEALSAYVRPQSMPSSKPTPQNTLKSRRDAAKAERQQSMLRSRTLQPKQQPSFGIALPFATPSEDMRDSPVFPEHIPTPSPTPELTPTPVSSNRNLASSSASSLSHSENFQRFARHHLASASGSSCHSAQTADGNGSSMPPQLPAPNGSSLASRSGSLSRATGGGALRSSSLSRHSSHGLINAHNRNDSNSVNVLTHEAEGTSLSSLTRHKRTASNASSAAKGNQSASYSRANSNASSNADAASSNGGTSNAGMPQKFHTRSAQGRQAAFENAASLLLNTSTATCGEDTMLDTLSLRDLRRVSANTYPHCELKLKFAKNNRLLLTLWDTEELSEWFRKFSQILEKHRSERIARNSQHHHGHGQKLRRTNTATTAASGRSNMSTSSTTVTANTGGGSSSGNSSSSSSESDFTTGTGRDAPGTSTGPPSLANASFSRGSLRDAPGTSTGPPSLANASFSRGSLSSAIDDCSSHISLESAFDGPM